MDKLKFTAWFEVNPTFGSREIRLLKPGGPFAPPPGPDRVKSLISRELKAGLTSNQAVNLIF